MVLAPQNLRYFQLIALIFILVCSVYTKQSQEIVVLSFDVHTESDIEHTKIKIQFSIGQKDSSLEIAQQQADHIEGNIIKILKSYCEQFIESEYDCIGNLEEHEVQFQAFYRTIKGKDYFQYFQVNQKFQIIIPNQGNFGVLVDKLQEIDSVKVTKVQWEIQNQENEQYLLEKGKNNAIFMCHNLGLQFYRIVQIIPILPTQEEKPQPKPQPKQGEQEQQQQEVPDEPKQIQSDEKPAYHFKAECRGQYIAEKSK